MNDDELQEQDWDFLGDLEFGSKFKTDEERKIKTKERQKQWRIKNKEKLYLQNAEWKNKNRDRINEAARQWRAENREYYNNYVRELNKRTGRVKNWALKNPDKIKKFRRKKTLKHYKMTEGDYFELLKNQNGVCAICHNENRGKNASRKLSVDHCHSTGVIRGLLCVTCNLAISYFNEDKEIFMRAISYIERHSKGVL